MNSYFLSYCGDGKNAVSISESNKKAPLIFNSQFSILNLLTLHHLRRILIGSFMHLLHHS